MSNLRSDTNSNFKWLLGAYGAGVLLTLGAIASGFVYLVDKLPG